MAVSTPEKLHPTTVATVQGSHALGRQVMSLRYDLVADVLQGMLDEASRQAEADAARGRPRLAGQLDNVRLTLASAIGAAKGLAAFCKPQIDAEVASPAPAPADHAGWRFESYTQYDSDPRPYWRLQYEEFAPHESRAYTGGEPKEGDYRNLEPVFTSAEAFAPANLRFTDEMFRAFSETAMPGAWDTIPETQREEARFELTRAIRSFLAAARVQPGQTTE